VQYGFINGHTAGTAIPLYRRVLELSLRPDRDRPLPCQAFEHQSHFGRVFRRVDGASPSEWRANAKIPRRTRHGAPR
jgi:hypothetical protein